VSYQVDFEPIGRRAACKEDETLLAAAQRLGILLNATCGGDGICGNCAVQVMGGETSPVHSVEAEWLGPERLATGWRLACQAGVRSDVRIHIPPESLATNQRIQTEGRDLPVQLDPAVRRLDMRLAEPSLKDLRSDASRLEAALGLSSMDLPLSVVQRLPDDLRDHQYNLGVFLRGKTLVGISAPGTSPLGVAVDLGTTKLAAYLVDLESGKTIASAGAMNPQIAYGEDVISRIRHAGEGDGAAQLQSAVTGAVARLAQELCNQAGRKQDHIADIVVVGNTAMHHLFLGLPVRQLGLAPFVPAVSDTVELPAQALGLEFAPGANIHLLPNIAGFIGADHVAMLLGSGLPGMQGNCLGIDIGTNTEISLVTGGRHFACSAASGPAFEGAHIRHGMRAGSGAIEKVLIRDGKFVLQTIDGKPPVGICGSGILDLVAALYKAGMIDKRGALIARDHPLIRRGKKGMEVVLVPAKNAEEEITFSRGDINEIQLAKSAIRTAIEILLQRAKVSAETLDRVVIAGAFGTYLDVESGMRIGMFPPLPREKYIQVGNAAGAGARMALLSMDQRAQAVEIARRVNYVELTNESSFSSLFAKNLGFENSGG
jgi:uncharacterized 2Fe-2S/4Fe-4S cluster protein (DUF4445 family)